MSEREEKKSDSGSRSKSTTNSSSSSSPPPPDYYDAFIITQKCYGILQYSDTPDKGESFKCQGIKRLCSAHSMQGMTPMTADVALHAFERRVDQKHHLGGSLSSSGEGFGGGDEMPNNVRSSPSRQKRINKLKNAKTRPSSVPPEQWKLVRDQKFDVLQRLLENHQSNSSSGVHPGKSSASESTSEKNKKTKIMKEIHASFYGVTETENLVMTKDHMNMPISPMDYENSQKNLKPYKVVPISKFGVAKRSLTHIEYDQNPNATNSNAKIGSGSGTKKECIASATTSRLGFIEIDMQGFEEILHPDGMDMDQLEDRRQEVQRDDAQEKNNKKSSGDGLLPLSSTISPSSNSSIIPTSQEVQEFNDNFKAASYKIITHMRANANFVYKELTADDFFHRTMNAGDRIVASGEKNLERMKKLMINGYKWMQGPGW